MVDELGGARVSRRAVLRGAAALGVAVFLPVGRAGAAIAVPLGEDRPRFLEDPELATLRALVDRLVPGAASEDIDPGALEAGCAEAIDALLAAFEVDPPLIFAGGPFSDRAGSEVNHFEDFVPLDDYEVTAWRLRIEGSRGDPDLEFNGEVPGYRTIYREGLAALDQAAGGSFAALPFPAREIVLRTADDGRIGRLVDIAFPHTLQFLYGAPEYGGNRDLIGWRITGYDGDVQPRGYTREQVEQADQPGIPDLLQELGLDLTELLPMASMISTEQHANIAARSGGTLTGARDEADAVHRGLAELERQRTRLAGAVAEVTRTIQEASRGR